jgi:hypothetical protein
VEELSRNVLWVFAFIMVLTVTLGTLFAGASVSNVDNRAYEYQNAPQVPANARAILASLGTSLTPDELSNLRNRLGTTGIQKWNPTGNATAPNTLAVYLQTISNASSNLVQIGVVLGNARRSLAIGDVKSVQSDIRTLDTLSSGAQNLLGSSLTTLDEITATYGIDTSTQASKVRQLNEQLQGYMLDINDLKVKASGASFQPTALSLNASVNHVFVGDTFTAGGFLRWKQAPLGGRSITISWGTGNQSLTTNSTGAFQSNLYFPFGTPSGSAIVEAFYEPSANDSLTYQAAYSAIQITVNYERTQISASLNRDALRPTESALITGSLGTPTGQSLVGQPISVDINGLVVGNTTTLTNGAFYFILTIPETMRNGTYNATLNFNPSTGRYAASTFLLQFNVLTVPSRMELKADRGLAFSGTNLTLGGGITYTNGTAANGGTLLIYLDNALYANTSAIRHGTFQYSIGLPIWAGLGSHSLTVKYVPIDPSVNGSQSTVLVYVVSTPLILFAAATLVGASVVSLALLRRRRGPISRLPPSAVAEAVVVERPRPVFPTGERYEESLALIQAEPESSVKVRKAYALAQALIDARLGEEHRGSETASEYYLRVAGRLAQISDSLKRLSELFELADYSQFPISQAQSDSALEALRVIQNEIRA